METDLTYERPKPKPERLLTKERKQAICNAVRTLLGILHDDIIERNVQRDLEIGDKVVYIDYNYTIKRGVVEGFHKSSYRCNVAMRPYGDVFKVTEEVPPENIFATKKAAGDIKALWSMANSVDDCTGDGSDDYTVTE